MKSFVNLLLVSLLALINSCLCDEILGCNGFIKSEVGLSFSSVEVQLYTKQGALKEHTDCAPSNGYFFLPIYDKGEYILKVSPPLGWKFEPTEVPILFDGVSDPCSKGKDINFNFMGFAVDGQVVSSGFSVGPKDVTVELYSQGSNSPTLVTTTGANGNFLFSPVLPGSYKVKISHPRWKPEKNEASVVVKDANGKIPVGSLSIAGYDITGMVTSDSQPITGVSFVLYSKNQQAKVSGCDQSALPGFKVDASLGVVPICHVMSNAQGVFYFPQISPGDYHLVPHYKGSESTKFDVHPKSLSITVGHSSLHLSSAFQVKGFTVAGKVLWSPKGKPMKGATIYLNGKMVSKSGNDGVFSLESMRARTYTIKIEAENVVFKESEVKVSSTSLPDFYPISYKVCGRFHSPTASGPYRIELTSEDSTKSEVSTDSNGSYCLYLAPGKYTFTPDPDSARLSSGLLFSPSKRLVQVEDQPLNNIDFSQLRSTVKGKILCMTQCPLITVNLKPKSQGATALQTIAKNGHYEFTEVMPGDYDIYLEPGLGWCWDKDSQSLTVINEVTEVLAFTQTGFIVTIVSSHSTSVVYFSEGQTNDKLKLEVVPGSTHICVPKSTPYIFQPVGCHGYEQPQFRWVTGTVNLNAVTHANAFFFLASEEITDLTLNVEPVESAETSHPKVLAPGPGVKVEEGIKYEIELQLRPNEKLKITPVAGIFLFTPQSAEVKGHTDCFNSSKSLFSAEKGQIITGKVLSGENKGISGVTITIKDEMGAVVATEATDATGAYKFPPLKALPNIKIIAEKEGYVLTNLAKFGDFSAHKLAEIIVTVSDEATKEKLQGVLLSLSGGKSYRRNAQTSAEGTMSFLSLSPGEYFLKPMMKEYKFHPQNKIINVKEGATVTVNLSGERVAYSGIGEVTSLSGEGEGGVVVEAIGVGDCAAYQEESTSNESGLFRIRGLKPNCEYNVRVKEGVDVNHHILKSGQDTVPIKVKMADVSGLKLYVLRPSTRVDVMVYVVADRAEDLKTLRLRLTREDSPDVAVSVMKLSEYKPSPSGYALTSVMIVLPPLPADGRSYVLQLESSLPLGTHEYINRPVHFKASGSLKVFRMAFSPNLKSRDPDLSQSSYLVLPFLILVGITFYNKDAVIGLATSALEKSRPATVTAKPTTDDTMVPDLFPEFPKKKSKSRKT